MIYMVTPHGRNKVGVPLKVTSMSLDLKERDSTASMTLDDRADLSNKEITGMWFYDDDNPGGGIYWRARSLTEAKHTKTPVISLEHVISTLKDTIIFEEINPATITGDSTATVAGAKETIQYLLGKQTVVDWTLNQFQVDDIKQGYTFEGETLYDAIVTVCSTLDNCWWQLGMGTYPFHLNIMKMDDSVGTMMRPGRNIRTISQTIDKSGMYTRIWPVGKDDLHLKGQQVRRVDGQMVTLAHDYLASKTETYGIIDYTETDTSRETAQELYDWAHAKLKNHCRPVVKVEVEGLELSDKTGEPMDKINLGRICQMVVNGKTLNERIIGLSYPDKVKTPELVKVTMSNKQDDIARIVAQEKKKQSKSGRAGSRQSKQTREILYNTVKEVQISGPNDKNKYKLQYKLVKDTDWKDGGTFSRAVDDWEVGAKDGVITLTAQPQNQSKDINIKAGDPARTKDTNNYTGKIQYSSNGGKNWHNTGAEYAVDATDVYKDGEAHGKTLATVAGNWKNGTFTAYNTSNKNHQVETAIFDLTDADVSWSDRTGTITLYANKDGGETKLATGKTLTVTAPVQHPTIGGSWSGGELTITTTPSATSNKTYAIFDVTNADVSWTGNTGTFHVYVNQDGGETKIDTGKILTVTANVVPTIGGSWASGTLTITTTPASASAKTYSIFDVTGADVSWTGNVGTFPVYVNQDGGETKIFTGKYLSVTANVVPTISGSWSGGTLTITTIPASASPKTYSIFDVAAGDVVWTGNIGSFPVYVNQDGGETKLPTGKTLTVTANVVPTIAGSWANGTLTITTNPAAAAAKTYAIFDVAAGDVTWSGNTGSFPVYVNQDGGETRIATGKTLTVTANVVPTIGGMWSGGTLTINTNPAAAAARTYSIFDVAAGDVTWSVTIGGVQIGSFPVYVNQDGGETKIATGKTLIVTPPAVSPTIGGSWSGGTLTITTTPSASSNKTYSIFDTTADDVTWADNVGSVKVYVNQDGGETKINTGKTLVVTAPFTRYTFKKAYGTNDQPYRGNIYDANGNLLGGNYYWYGYGENFGSGVNVYMWRN